MTVALTEDPILLGNSKPILAAVGKSALPAIGFLEFTEHGGLMTYGVNIAELLQGEVFTCASRKPVAGSALSQRQQQ